MRISDWSSDVCSSDLCRVSARPGGQQGVRLHLRLSIFDRGWRVTFDDRTSQHHQQPWRCPECLQACLDQHGDGDDIRSEEHTSELQSLMRISYAVFCLKKKREKKS